MKKFIKFLCKETPTIWLNLKTEQILISNISVFLRAILHYAVFGNSFMFLCFRVFLVVYFSRIKIFLLFTQTPQLKNYENMNFFVKPVGQLGVLNKNTFYCQHKLINNLCYSVTPILLLVLTTIHPDQS